MSAGRSRVAAVAVGALVVVGLGGASAVAAKQITGHQIKDGSITAKDIRNGSLGGGEFKDGSVGLRVLTAAAEKALRGATGATGPQGAPGADGADGADGAKGATGATGPQGEAGADGANGATGAPGLKGDTGAKGDKGDKGDNGLAGAYYAQAAYNVGDTNQGAVATVACEDSADTAISGGVQTLGLEGGHPAAVASSFPGRMDWSTNTPKPGRLDGWIVQFDASVAPMKTTIWALCVPNATIPVVQTFSQAG